VLITRIVGRVLRVLRWVLSCKCVACNRKISDLDPGCIECDRLARTGAADVLNQEQLQRWRPGGRDTSAGLAVGQSSWAQAAWRGIPPRDLAVPGGGFSSSVPETDHANVRGPRKGGLR